MPGFDLNISLEGEKQLSRRLLIVADGITNFESPLRKIGGELQKSFQDNFAQEGALFGGWQDRAKDYPWPILQKTGRMRQSFKSRIDNRNTILLYNTAPYFVYHQSNKPRKRLPRRVMMKIDGERKDFIIKAFQAYIISLTRR